MRPTAWQQTLTSTLDRLGGCSHDEQRWACGASLLQDCGSEWMTAGTSPRNRLTDLAVRSTTPEALMQDYVGNRLHFDDPWMQLCASSRSVDLLEISDQTTAIPATRTRLARLFADHGVRRAVLVPCYGGQRTGGIVLYNRNAPKEGWEADPMGLQRARLVIAIFSACYRPEADRSQSPGLYRIGAVLTGREREVLCWLGSGLQTARIAERMGIEAVTVSKHLAAVRRKLGARTREQALAIAVKEELIAI
jgi:DNA-binding CsgD family transcriptional regulator